FRSFSSHMAYCECAISHSRMHGELFLRLVHVLLENGLTPLLASAPFIIRGSRRSFGQLMRTIGSGTSDTAGNSTGCCWVQSNTCVAVKSVVHFVLIFSFAACVAETVLSQDHREVDKTITTILADWDALPTVFDDIDIYARQIRELAEMGK